MAALYPLAYRRPWERESVIDAVSAVATSLGFAHHRTQPDTHYDDADRIVADIIRQHTITNASAIARLHSLRPSLSECYKRLEHHWLLGTHEITLIVCDSNVIPFSAPDVRDSGNIWFACGFVDIAMPDRDIDRLKLHDHMARLPLLFAPE
ncbi:MAG: hypothetical protein Aurels2KO_57290 [Aureliella sp.]